ncbi:ankyrin repeat domain-containing protein [Chitinophaga sp. Cy-1792]|uniref:ankyrin repeat domain-containing protein n=1 Tax=Chitinophaga sp. Cy-1792 TaxID=2608339 RepID=UPI00142313E8|nr:ankyrin repeat domain-containing protein [Chitinophaga sp. Cy-1792]NIG55171.1 ankyrin repeat domain-containing protein [Chitinophaga sp. Cy-1792]
MHRITLPELIRKIRTSEQPDEIIAYISQNLPYLSRDSQSMLLGELLEYQDTFFEAAELLTTVGQADIHYKKEGMIPIVFCAVGANKPLAVEYALAKGASLHIDSPDYLFAIAYIFREHRLSNISEMLLILIQRNIHFNFVLASLETPLLLATRYNAHPEVVHFLVEERVDKYAYDEDGFTALHYAAFGKAPNLHRSLITTVDDVLLTTQFATSMEPVPNCVIRVEAETTFEEFIYIALNAFLHTRHLMYEEIFEKYYFRLHTIAEHISTIWEKAGVRNSG